MAAIDVHATDSPSQILVIPELEKTIRKFTGQAGHHDLEVWLEDVDSAWTQRPGQTDSERAAFLWSHLEINVRQELNCQGVDRRDKNALLEALRHTYEDSSTLSALSVTFYTTRQESEEGVRQYSRRLCTAFQRLNRYRKRQSINSEDEACLITQFMEGLRDRMVKLILRKHSLANPHATFQELRKAVLSWMSEPETDSEPAKATVCSQIRYDTQPLQERLKYEEAKMQDRIADQAKLLAAQTQTINRLTCSVHSLERSESISEQKHRDSNFYKKDKSGPYCDYSVQKRWQDTRVGERRLTRRRRRVNCFFCGQHGHLIRSCRFKKRAEMKQTLSNSISEQAATAPLCSERQSAENTSERGTSFQRPQDTRLYNATSARAPHLSSSLMPNTHNQPEVVRQHVSETSVQSSATPNPTLSAREQVPLNQAKDTCVLSSPRPAPLPPETLRPPLCKPCNQVSLPPRRVARSSISSHSPAEAQWYTVLETPSIDNKLTRYLVRNNQSGELRFVSQSDLIAVDTLNVAHGAQTNSFGGTAQDVSVRTAYRG